MGKKSEQPKGSADDLDLSSPVVLVVLSVKDPAARCRLLGSDRVIILRVGELWELVPGEIVTINPRKQWRFGSHMHLSGEIASTRLSVAELGLVPLGLEDYDIWDPGEHYWGEEDEPIEEWAKPIIARGPRPQFEMQRVLPGADPDDPFSDPINEANDLKHMGDPDGARSILMELCQSDLRCLDAHSHLGNLACDHWPQYAIRHYEVGLRIGELSLSEGFAGLLPWGLIDNRPFLRCMHGYGLCLWRLERFDQAEEVFERMLWLNPSDNQGVRFLIDDVRAGRSWEESVEEEEKYEEEQPSRGDKRTDLRMLEDVPPWDWPQGASAILVGILCEPRADESDRLLAADLAGDCIGIDDELVDALLSIVGSAEETEKLRAKAAIALGPVLELADMDGFDDDSVPISEATFLGIQGSFRRLYMDAVVPKFVRRRILEASVRAVQDWHHDAIRAAYSSDDRDWKLTAVFAMCWVPGFHDQILDALENTDPDIHYQAVCAAGDWEVDAAWPHVAALVTSLGTDKPLLLAAIDAVGSIRPHQADEVLFDLTGSDDEDIVEAAEEAMTMAGFVSGEAVDVDDEDGMTIH